ncbi:MAG: hypothetical protein M1820_004095 [Bogoriella megaspora]|nr:MAG: hypothetical protein M1820_004095 [Bogoriella megaspora]
MSSNNASTHRLSTFRYDATHQTFIQKSALRELGPNEVLIKTTHSGICFTDVHAKEKGCGLGHEGVGRVEKVGLAVNAFESGDRAGWGWLHHSCGRCKVCVEGYRQYCSEARGFAFGELDQGAFGDYAIWNQDFVYHIPDQISSIHAGPFMCAGASVYEALDAANTKSSDRVGVVGIGGLGHMAILFARAMGCAVTAFSRTDTKEADARALGVDTFINPDSPEKIAKNNAIDVVLLCSNGITSLEPFLPYLARRARLVLMTIQQGPVTVPYMPFVLPGHQIIASTEASRKNHIAMLEFVVRHNITPWVQTFPMTAEGVAEAFSTLEKGQMRFRGVLARSD